MSPDSFSYLTSKSQNIVTHGKILVLFSLAFFMLLPALPAPARNSAPYQISRQVTSGISPSVAADFSLSASPASIITTAGSTKIVQIMITSTGGFAGQVYMSASAFAFPVSFPVTLNPPIVSLSSGTASSTLTITIPSNASPGDNSVFLQATGGCTLSHFFDISVTVTGPDFTITSEKAHITLAQGGSDTAKIDLASVNGFSGLVNLGSFSQFTTSLNPTSVTLSSGGTASSILTIAVPNTVGPGNYTVSVDGFYSSSTGFLSHSADILITITGGSFFLTASQYFLTLTAGGASNSSTIIVNPTGGFTGTVTLSAAPPIPLSPSLSVPSVTGSGSSVLTVSASGGTKAGNYYVDITGTSGSLHASTTVFVKVKAQDFEISADPFFLAVVAGGSSCTSTITLTSILGFNANVGLVLTASSSLTTNLNPLIVTPTGTSTLTVSAPTGTVPGFYSADVNGTSTSPARTHSTSVDILVIGPDFTLSANPDSLTIMAGSSGTSTITLTPLLAFSGTVSLTATPFDPELTPTVTPTITSSSPATLSVAVASGTVPGDFYSVEVNGTSGQLTHSIYISITVTGPSFSLSANPATLTFSKGGSKTSAITINPTNGFASPVDLFVSPSSADLNASISPTTVNSGSYTATLSVNSTIPGSYTVDVTGSSTSSTGGVLFNDTTETVNVIGADFTVSPSPTTIIATAGGSQTSTISIKPLNGFTGSVDLSATSPTGLTPVFSPTTITSSTTSTLTVNVDPTTIPGSYTVDIQGKGGSLDRTAQLTVNVAGFTLAPNPDTLTIAQGASQTSTITVAPFYGFSSTVQLTASLPAGLTGTPNPASIPGASGSSQLSITAASNITPGTYLVNVTGTSGALSQKITITITVPPPAPDFTVSANPTSLTITAGGSKTSSITINPLNGFTSSVALTSSAPSGLTPTFVPTSITPGTPSTLTVALDPAMAPGTYTIDIHGTSGSLDRIAQLTINVPDFTLTVNPNTPTIDQGATQTVAITVASLYGFTDTVQLSVAFPSGLSGVLSSPSIIGGSGMSTLPTTASSNIAPGTYLVNVTGTSGSLSRKAMITVTVPAPDFGISASPTTVPCTIANSCSTSITVAALNGFTGTVSFTVSASSPAGLTCTAPGSVSGTTLTSNLSCNSSTPGDYTVTVTGTSGSLSHPTANIIFHVSGFTVEASSPAAANTGQTATSTITVTPVNGFTGTVQLSDTPLPIGLICSAISQTSVTITSAAATATLACYSTYDGAFTVAITATSSSLVPQATATFTFHAPDITIASTTPASTIAGQSATSTITVTAVNGFAGTVSLAVSAPSGISCTLNYATLQGSGSAILTCTSNTANDYAVTVTATGGATAHSITATFHVSAAPSPVAPAPSIFGVSPIIFYGLIAVLIIAVIGGVVIAFRRKNA